MPYVTHYRGIAYCIVSLRTLPRHRLLYRRSPYITEASLTVSYGSIHYRGIAYWIVGLHTLARHRLLYRRSPTLHTLSRHSLLDRRSPYISETSLTVSYVSIHYRGIAYWIVSLQLSIHYPGIAYWIVCLHSLPRHRLLYRRCQGNMTYISLVNG